MYVAYPSETFPGPPPFRIVVPNEWEPVDHPDAAAGAVEAGSPDEFKSNIVVQVSRMVGSATLDEVVAKQMETAQAMGASVEHQEHKTLAGRDSVWSALILPLPKLAIFQVQATLLVPRVREITDVITLIGTCAATHSGQYASLFRESFLSFELAPSLQVADQPV